MHNYRIVPDSVRNRGIVTRGRRPTNKLSLDLLAGKTVHVQDTKGKTWGSIYKLAKNHNMRAHIRWEELNDEKGYTMYFLDRDKEE